MNPTTIQIMFSLFTRIIYHIQSHRWQLESVLLDIRSTDEPSERTQEINEQPPIRLPKNKRAPRTIFRTPATSGFHVPAIALPICQHPPRLC